MKRMVSINITMDSETAEITYLNISEESSGSNKFVIKGIEKPISVCNTVDEIYNFLGDLIDIE